jgi:hypothetical protein
VVERRTGLAEEIAHSFDDPAGLRGNVAGANDLPGVVLRKRAGQMDEASGPDRGAVRSYRRGPGGDDLLCGCLHGENGHSGAEDCAGMEQDRHPRILSLVCVQP